MDQKSKNFAILASGIFSPILTTHLLSPRSPMVKIGKIFQKQKFWNFLNFDPGKFLDHDTKNRLLISIMAFEGKLHEITLVKAT